MRFYILVTAVAAWAVALPVFSQQMNMAGRWQCEYGVRETIVRENNLPTVFVQLEMIVYENGTFQAQGIENEQFPFQAQGQWVLDGSLAFIAQGQKQDNFGIGQFFFSSNVKASNVMNSNDIGPTGKQVVSQCQKIG